MMDVAIEEEEEEEEEEKAETKNGTEKVKEQVAPPSLHFFFFDILVGSMKPIPGRSCLSASITAHGHRKDAITSWLQKAVRRSDVPAAIYCGLELYLFHLIADNHHHESPDAIRLAAQRIVSNTLNRLLIMGAEDVGLAEPSLPPKALELYREAARKPVSPKGLLSLIQWIKALCRSRKARSLSDLGIFWKPEKAAWALQQPDLVIRYFSRRAEPVDKLCAAIRDNEQLNILPSKRFDQILGLIKNDLVGWHGMDYQAERFLCLLELRDPLALYFCERDFVSSSGVLQPKLGRRSKPVYLVWAMLNQYNLHRAHLDSNLIESLQEMHDRLGCGHREAPLFLYQAVMFFVWHNRVSDCSLPAHSPPPSPPLLDESILLQQEEEEEEGCSGVCWNVLQKHGETPPREVPDYALDKHTAQGRIKGKTSIDFVLDGAKVVNEVSILVDRELRALYVRSALEMNSTGGGGKRKKNQNVKRPRHQNKEKNPPRKKKKNLSPIFETEAFASPQRIQVLTGRGKPDTYFALDKRQRRENRPIFVKGPFLTPGKVAFQFELNQFHKGLYHGVNPIPDMEIVWLIPVANFLGGRENPPNFGTRTKTKPGQAYPFLVCADLNSPHRNRPYPMRTYGKAGGKWPADTPLVDTSSPSSSSTHGMARHLNLPWLANTDSYCCVQISILVAILFRYVWRVTDTCCRNILLCSGTVVVYSVDEESSGGTEQDLCLFKKPLTGENQASMIKLLCKHWETTLVLDYLKPWTLVKIQPNWVRANIERLIKGGLDGVLKLV